jgi:hypothetical protein
MVKALLWKEWRETRWKWLAFALAFHIPLFIAGLTMALRESARFDLYALSDGIAAQVLEVAVVAQSAFLITAGLFLLAFFAVGSVGAELDNRSIFFLFERPVRRWHVLLLKYLVGAAQTMTCVGLSILTTVALVYFAMAAAAPNVTLEGSWGAFAAAASNGTRGTVWTMVIGLMVYSATSSSRCSSRSGGSRSSPAPSRWSGCSTTSAGASSSGSSAARPATRKAAARTWSSTAASTPCRSSSCCSSRPDSIWRRSTSSRGRKCV